MTSRVSVVMPAYNVEKYIAEAIESILAQTFKDFELIILDDCSADNTLQIINKYAKLDDRIVVLRNDKNLRLARTLNRGIKAARGKYIARMDGDDISLPDRFEKQVCFMEENPEVGILGGTMIVMNKTGEMINERRYYTQDKEIRESIFKFSPFCHPVIMIRKSVLEKAGLYDPYYNPAEDYELYFRVGLHSKFANLKDPLIRYRIVGGSMTTGGLKKMELKTIESRRKFYNLYNASLIDKTYTTLHYFSVVVPIMPPKVKMWLFSKIRGFIKPKV